MKIDNQALTRFTYSLVILVFLRNPIVFQCKCPPYFLSLFFNFACRMAAAFNLLATSRLGKTAIESPTLRHKPLVADGSRPSSFRLAFTVQIFICTMRKL